VRARVPDADPEDVLLFDDLVGIADPEVPLPRIDPDARRRRLTALVKAASLARENPAVYIVEDTHWIDEVSESMLADFFTVIPQTPSLVLLTYRSEYRGALTQVAGAQTVVLAPLTDSETAALVSELLGPDPCVGRLGQTIVHGAAGNPFFAEEIVRDLAERGVLRGERGAYVSMGEVAEVSVPATLQAIIAARIDRLPPQAKRTLNAAAVIGSRFNLDLLTQLGVEPVVADLAAAQFIDQVTFTREPEYVFHHPLIRTVAYESQLKFDRAQMHRRLAAAIEQGDPASADENAALIAEHLEAAGDLHAAYVWHMRAAAWLNFRDIAAAHTSWRRARQVADRLPDDDPDRLLMRIAPRTLLCGSHWRAGGSVADSGFDELRELTVAAGDQVSLAIGMAGQVTTLVVHARYREGSRLTSEYTSLLESIGDPTLTVALLYAALGAKFQTGEMSEVLRLAQRVIELAEGDPGKGNLVIGSPLQGAIGYRGFARCSLGLPGWNDDIDQRGSAAGPLDPTLRALMLLYKYGVGIPNGWALPGAAAMRETAEMLEFAKRAGDDLTLAIAQFARGLTLVEQEGPDRRVGFDLLAQAREAALQERFNMVAVVVIDIELAKEKARNGEIDSAIELARAVIDDEFDTGEMIFRGPATSVLVESLLQRGADGDVDEARAELERLAAVPTDPGFVLHELPLLRLRALLAEAHGDETSYRDYRDRYRAMATSLGFEGHMAWAEAMP
jgi:adenylate cyclase